MMIRVLLVSALLCGSVLAFPAEAVVVYTFDTDTQGWVSGHASAVLAHADGALALTYADPGSNPFDPYLNGPNALYNADAYPEFAMGLSVEGAPEGALNGAVYWFPESGGHGMARFTAQNGSQVVRLNLAAERVTGTADHAGIIRNIRIDFPEGADGDYAAYAGATVRIDWVAVTATPGLEQPPEIPDMTLDNGIIKVGADLGSGGAITYLSLSGSDRNLINNYDRGRQVQQSYYAGQSIDRRDEGQSSVWSPWPWNPIQVGDAFGHSGIVLEARNENGELYSKTWPLLWDMNNEFAECHMETWITLDRNTVHVRNKLTTFRTDNRWDVRASHQELPAVYTIGDLPHLYTYEGDAPFTNAPLTVKPRSFPWTYWDAGEKWAANVDDNLWGVGVYYADTELFVGGFAGSPGGGTYDGSTGYISPLRTMALEKDTVFEYEYDLVVGTLDEIRAFVYNAEGHEPAAAAATGGALPLRWTWALPALLVTALGAIFTVWRPATPDQAQG